MSECAQRHCAQKEQWIYWHNTWVLDLALSSHVTLRQDIPSLGGCLSFLYIIEWTDDFISKVLYGSYIAWL